MIWSFIFKISFYEDFFDFVFISIVGLITLLKISYYIYKTSKTIRIPLYSICLFWGILSALFGVTTLGPVSLTDYFLIETIKKEDYYITKTKVSGNIMTCETETKRMVKKLWFLEFENSTEKTDTC